MGITLAKDVEEFLNDQVKAGACKDPGELVNDLVRSIRDQQEHPLSFTSELEDWLLEAADDPGTPLTKKDFEDLRERVKSRLTK